MELIDRLRTKIKIEQVFGRHGGSPPVTVQWMSLSLLETKMRTAFSVFGTGYMYSFKTDEGRFGLAIIERNEVVETHLYDEVEPRDMHVAMLKGRCDYA